jgi:hypothetical protein
VPKHLSRAALLVVLQLLAGCAAGVSPDDIQQILNGANADAGATGGTAGTGGPGGAQTGGPGGPIVPTLTGGLTGAQTGGPGGVQPGAPGGTSEIPAGARMPQKLPTPSGACPEFAGTTEVQVVPMGMTARRVQIWSGQGSGGALVIYWHSTAGMPAEASVALSGVIETITAAGGVVAAPAPGATEGMYPWVDTMPASMRVADEIVACALMKKNINPARIHTLGYSAGGLMAGTLAVQRSSYVASMAAYSGGQTGTARGMFEDATNKLSGILFHGGSTDMAGGTNFPAAASNYAMTLRANGGTAVVCNHNMGRLMPPDGPAAVLRFFDDHPYGRPSPYAAMLPAGLPASCQLQM